MKKRFLAFGLAAVFLFLTGCNWLSDLQFGVQTPLAAPPVYTAEELPAYAGNPFVALYENQPRFEEEEKTDRSYEYYSPLDALGRCGYAFACVGQDLMPTEKRGSIGQVKPSGWQTTKYDHVDGKYLYNRCHLIGYQLSGENANERNLITGTRYLNVQGMLPFENMVADYVKETGNHVLYRVTPIFREEDLVAQGVIMEAWSVEDEGDGVCFCVFCYNVQPGVVIDYATGESRPETAENSTVATYVLNAGSRKFHAPDCESVTEISEKNRRTYQGTREALIAQGYSPCSRCDP